MSIFELRGIIQSKGKRNRVFASKKEQSKKERTTFFGLLGGSKEPLEAPMKSLLFAFDFKGEQVRIYDLRCESFSCFCSCSQSKGKPKRKW